MVVQGMGSVTKKIQHVNATKDMDIPRILPSTEPQIAQHEHVLQVKHGPMCQQANHVITSLLSVQGEGRATVPLDSAVASTGIPALRVKGRGVIMTVQDMVYV
jgi:hypothetical protein